MTTLQAIGFTAAVGSIVGASCLVGFGLALRARSTNVAPRCTARSPDTIYAVHPKNAAQARQRGTGPFLGWIGWSLRLSYDTLLRGVPGTGTRGDGMRGNLLKSNLDGIIMLRFHSISLRVATLTSVLVLGIVLPLNLTANCYENDQFTDPNRCFDPNQKKAVPLTNYERTTIANIPPVVKGEYDPTINLSIDSFKNAIWSGHLSLWRLYVIVLCSWVVFWYACSLLKNEWKEALALRRVYYLENDVWQRRKKDLDETVLLPRDYWSDEGSDASDDDEDGNDGAEEGDASTPVGATLRDGDAGEHEESTGSNSGGRLAQLLNSRKKDTSKSNGGGGVLEGGNGGIYTPSRHEELLRQDPGCRRRATSTSSTAVDLPQATLQNGSNGSPSLPERKTAEKDCGEPKLRNVQKRSSRPRRDPWIPNPEMRDTVPNIELYSVLVGDIPRLPSEVVRESDVEDGDGYSPRQALDWQLAVVSTFFNQCVPNQPGFSSSVAAVTILPDASDLALAWRKWYAAGAALRRLKFIRRLMMELRDREEEVSIEAQEEGLIVDAAGEASEAFRINANLANDRSRLARAGADIPFNTNPDVLSSRHFFGLNDDLEVERLLFRAWNYGPEQTAMYSRELAQGASSFCPNGCCEGRLRRIRQNDQLMELEQEALIRVHEAHIELANAREMAAVNVLPTSRPSAEQLEAKKCNPVPYRTVVRGRCADSGNMTGAREPRRRRSWTASNEASPPLPRGPHHVTSRTAFDGNFHASLALEALLLAKYGGDDEKYPTNSIPPQIAMGILETPLRSNLSKKTTNHIASVNGNKPSVPSHKQDSKVENCSGDGAYVSISSTMSSAKVARGTSPAVTCSSAALKPSTSPVSNGQDPAAPNRHRTFSAGSEPSVESFGSFPRRSYREYMGGRNMSLDSEGKFVMRRFVSFASTRSGQGILVPGCLEENGCESATSFDVGAGNSQNSHTSDGTLSRRRVAHTTNGSTGADAGLQQDDRWSQAQTIRRQQSRNLMRSLLSTSSEDAVGTGVWTLPSPQNVVKSTCSIISDKMKKCLIQVRGCAASRTHKVVHEIKSKSTFAIVTFTSRQSAVAARHCRSDGRGGKRWMTIDHLVVPPLADAGNCDLVTCRGCCRPVTLSINRNQQLCRRILAFAALFAIYTFWTVPFTFVASFFQPSNLETYMPHLEEKTTEQFRRFFFAFTGLVPGLLQTVFIALCPMLFRTIANSGSNAHSVAGAEGSALKYYWWFMVVTAFSGTSILTMVVNGFNNGTANISFTAALVEIANSIPTQVSSVWINWIILRSTATLPSQYMLQFNAFLFDFLGWQCCKRATLGGGPGADIPYRVYVDSGVVFMCTVALSFASPLVAPCAMLCLLISVPILRRNCVFVYRPKFDGGGLRWPFLFDIFISSMVLGQVLLFTMILLKQAIGPALFAIAPLGPTLIFRSNCRKRFYRAYQDAGLLQTSLLDGWDNEVPTTMEKREDFRRFLVDAHKAAYIPVCIAGHDATSVLTSEPAVAVPSEFDAVPLPMKDASAVA